MIMCTFIIKTNIHIQKFIIKTVGSTGSRRVLVVVSSTQPTEKPQREPTKQPTPNMPGATTRRPKDKFNSDDAETQKENENTQTQQTIRAHSRTRPKGLLLTKLPDS
jgi:hypothetical protein